VVDVIVQNVSITGFTDLTFTIGRTDYKKAMQITEKAAKDVGAEKVVGDDKIAKVSIVGMAMRSHSGVALKVFETLAAEGSTSSGSPPPRSRSPFLSKRSTPSWPCACSTRRSDWGNPPDRAHRTRKTRSEGRDAV